MPKIPNTYHRWRLQAVALGEEFDERKEWRRSATGNLTRTFLGERLTVFKSRGRYGWSRCSEDGKQFSPRRYATEREALDELRLAVIRDWY